MVNLYSELKAGVLPPLEWSNIGHKTNTPIPTHTDTLMKSFSRYFTYHELLFELRIFCMQERVPKELCQQKTNQNIPKQNLFTSSFKFIYQKNKTFNNFYIQALKPLIPQTPCPNRVQLKIVLKCFLRVLATVKNSAVNAVFTIWPVIELPNLCYPNTE